MGGMVAACEYHRGSRHGRAYYEYAHAREEGAYDKGKRHGRWELTDSNGQKRQIVDYDHEVRNGDWCRWYANGQMAESGKYHRDASDGDWTWWHENGTKAQQRSFSKGVPVGTHRTWDKGGNLLDHSEFHKGTGRWTEHYDNGEKKVEGEYREGRRHGCWRRWDRDGRLLGTFVLDRGTGTLMEWDDSGRKRTQIELLDDERHGTATMWNENGHIESIETYGHGCLLTTHEYEEGRLTQIIEWCNNEIVKSADYQGGALIQSWERLPEGGERLYLFENGSAQEVSVRIGHRHEVVKSGVSTHVHAPRPSASSVHASKGKQPEQTEMHGIGNMRVSFEVVSDRVSAVEFQVGDTAGAHRRLRFEAPCMWASEGTGSADSAADDNVLRARFRLMRVHQRMDDGAAFDVDMEDGKVVGVCEWKHDKIVRSVSLDEPSWMRLEDLRALIDDLVARGAELG
jgi:antitoxin component YwqK of YwqJK toxin-antitoxin module